MFDKVKGAAAVAGVAIGAALAAGAVQALEKSKLDGVLAAQLGASPADAAALGKLSGQVYAAGFGEDMTGVSAAIKTAAQNGLIDMANIGDAASKATVEKLLTVSQVVGDETERVSAAVSTMLQTGMAGSAEEAMDMIVTATQIGVNKSGDLLDTFEEYSTLFRSLGIDGQQSIGLLSQALQGGARNADQAADALKELGIRAIDGSKGARDAYKLLGLDADAMIRKIAKGGPAAAQGMDQILDGLRSITDPVKQNAAGVGLLGTKWEDMRDAVLSMDLTTATGQMDGLAGATDAAGKAIGDTAGQKLERFKRQAQMALVDNLAKAVPYIEATFGWLQKNSGWVTPLATGLGILAGVIGAIVIATKIWTAVQTAFNIVMAMNPVVLIVLAIIALIAVIVLIATKTTWFQTAWNTAWGAIKTAFWFVFNFIKNNWPLILGIITGPIGWAVLAVVKNWDRIKSATTAVKNWIVNAFVTVGNFIRSMPGRISSAASGMFNGIKNAFRSAVNWIIGKWNNLSLTIGGGSIMGMGIPSVTLSTPDIPYMYQGGTIRRGGAAVVADQRGRGGEMVHLPRGAQVTPLRGGAAGGPVVLEIRSGGTRLDDAIVEIVRRAVWTRGGNVQVVLGRSG